jgi:hypothetical protein
MCYWFKWRGLVLPPAAGEIIIHALIRSSFIDGSLVSVQALLLLSYMKTQHPVHLSRRDERKGSSLVYQFLACKDEVLKWKPLFQRDRIPKHSMSRFKFCPEQNLSGTLIFNTLIRLYWSRSAGIISRLKNTAGRFFVREKYCSSWKNKLNKTDYKPDEQGHY